MRLTIREMKSGFLGALATQELLDIASRGGANGCPT